QDFSLELLRVPDEYTSQYALEFGDCADAVFHSHLTRGIERPLFAFIWTNSASPLYVARNFTLSTGNGILQGVMLGRIGFSVASRLCERVVGQCDKLPQPRSQAMNSNTVTSNHLVRTLLGNLVTLEHRLDDGRRSKLVAKLGTHVRPSSSHPLFLVVINRLSR